MGSESTESTGSVLNQEAIEEVRSRIGDEHPAKPWWNVATEDTIKHYAEGYGDKNPLFTDPEYGKGTAYKSMVAPPTFLYSVIAGGGSTGGVGLPGAFTLHAEDYWEWHETVREGTRLYGTQKLLSVEEKPSTWAGRSVHQLLNTDFFDSKSDELVATYQMLSVRIDRRGGRASKKYDPDAAPEVHYSDAELQQISNDYDAEEVRGAAPRYWEDVQVGDSLGHVVKGPLAVRDIICWWMGRGAPLLKAFGHWDAYVKQRPGIAIVDPDTNIPDTPEAAHYDDKLARRSGVAGPYDIGHQRTAWCTHLLTNWCGDDGMVRSIRVRMLAPNYVGNTSWVRGSVAGKSEVGGRKVVECDLHVTTQNGEEIATASATVQLPSRSNG